MWLEVLYWIDHVWSSIECVCCACGPSEHLDSHWRQRGVNTHAVELPLFA